VPVFASDWTKTTMNIPFIFRKGIPPPHQWEALIVPEVPQWGHGAAAGLSRLRLVVHCGDPRHLTVKSSRFP
jgi:hypothetical protein